jgi:hypothetical protein
VAGSTENRQTRVNDLVIDLVPNKYASLSDNFSDAESESDDEDETPESLKSARKALDEVSAMISAAEERRSAAQTELNFLDRYVSTMSSASGVTSIPETKTMKDTLDLYNTQRKTHYDITTACTQELVDLEEKKKLKQKELDKEQRQFTRANREKVEARKRKQVEKEEKKREKNEAKPEKLRNVYRVRITIELPAAEATDDERSAKLTLTYTTTAASWTPHVCFLFPPWQLNF